MKILKKTGKVMGKAEEQQKENQDKKNYSFILFIVSSGENSIRAQENLKRLCEKWLPDRYTIKVVDVAEDFQTALDHNILVTPSVVITDPQPRFVIHGDLSDPTKFVDALNVHKE